MTFCFTTCIIMVLWYIGSILSTKQILVVQADFVMKYFYIKIINDILVNHLGDFDHFFLQRSPVGRSCTCMLIACIANCGNFNNASKIPKKGTHPKPI